MVSSSSSGQEFQTAHPSPERQETSDASSGEYHSASEYLQPTHPSYHATTINFATPNPALLGYPALDSTHPIIDPTNPRRTMARHNDRSTLSAAAPVFVPRAHAPTDFSTVPHEGRAPVSSTWSTSVMPPNRPTYDNQVPEVPSHWIPIYGSGHGIFYDPVTKLFYNDGPPRPTLERPDGTMQPMDDATPVPPIGFQPEDVLHLQPPSLTEPVARAMESNPHAIWRYYCRCRAAWLETPHGCPDEVGGEEHLRGPAPPIRATPGAIRPSDVLPPEYFTHDLAVGDLSYLTPQQRWARFGYQRSQRMYGLAETVDTRPWIYSEGEGGGTVFEGASARNERGSSGRRGAREQRAARNEARQSRGDYGH